MKLPEQMTGEAFRALLDEYEARMARLRDLPSEPETRVGKVEGGRVETRVQGYATIAPDGRLRRRTTAAGSLFRSRYPVVEVELVWADVAERGLYHIRTTPASLIQVDDRVVDEGFTAAPAGLHLFDVGRITDRVRLRFIVFSERFALAPAVSGAPTRLPVFTYEIPTAATAIFGQGLVHYATGQTMVVTYDAPLPLLRPRADGGLAVKPGGVYATFEGQEHAFAKVGSVWLPTRKLE